MDKKPLQSKKFMAYLLADLGWKACILAMLYQHADKFTGSTATVMLTMIVVSGFIQVGYILGQAALDKYVNLNNNVKNNVNK